MVLAAWCTKMMEELTKVIGDMAVGMDLDGPPLPTAIPTRVNTDLTNDTVVVSTVGQTDVSMMENSQKTNDTARELSNGQMEPPMRETFIKDNGKDTAVTLLVMADITQEVGSMDDTKDLENAIGRMVVITKVNGAQEWRTDKVWKPIRMGVFVTMDNGLTMSPSVSINLNSCIV